MVYDRIENLTQILRKTVIFEFVVPKIVVDNEYGKFDEFTDALNLLKRDTDLIVTVTKIEDDTVTDEFDKNVLIKVQIKK